MVSDLSSVPGGDHSVTFGQTVWHGSYNYTWKAENKNREEYTRDSNNEKVRQFAEEFVNIKKYIQQELNVRSQLDIE